MDAHVLIIDDSAILTKALTEILSLQGYQVESYGDGASGWDRLVAGAERSAPMPDLLLLDLNLPGVSGLKLLRRIQADERLAFMPVVVLTVEADAEIRIQALEAGANDYLIKPVQSIKLLALVKALLH